VKREEIWEQMCRDKREDSPTTSFASISSQAKTLPNAPDPIFSMNLRPKTVVPMRFSRETVAEFGMLKLSRSCRRWERVWWLVGRRKESNECGGEREEWDEGEEVGGRGGKTWRDVEFRALLFGWGDGRVECLTGCSISEDGIR